MSGTVNGIAAPVELVTFTGLPPGQLVPEQVTVLDESTNEFCAQTGAQAVSARTARKARREWVVSLVAASMIKSSAMLILQHRSSGKQTRRSVWVGFFPCPAPLLPNGARQSDQRTRCL